MLRKARVTTEVLSIQRLLTIIAASPSRNEKIELLRKYDSEVFRDILFYAYNPFITYGIVNITKNNSVAEGTKGEGVNWGEMKDLLIKLSSREYTGNTAREKIADLLTLCTLDQTELFLNIMKRDLRCKISIKTINKTFPDLVPEFNVMLCEKDKPITYPCIVEPKFNGVRTLNFVIQESVEHFSRNGLPFENFERFDDELRLMSKALGNSNVFDSEVTGIDWNTLMTMTKRKHNLRDIEMDMWIFDVVDLKSFVEQNVTAIKLSERKEMLNSIEKHGTKHVRTVPVIIVNNVEELEKVYNRYLSLGFEGVVIKNLNSYYQYKVSKDWIKKKPTETEDLKIIAYEEGEGDFVGMLGAFVVDYNGIQVNVGSGYSIPQRKEFWKEKDSLIDKVIEVEYQEVTKDGSLLFPVFVQFRPDKEL